MLIFDCCCAGCCDIDGDCVFGFECVALCSSAIVDGCGDDSCGDDSCEDDSCSDDNWVDDNDWVANDDWVADGSVDCHYLLSLLFFWWLYHICHFFFIVSSFILGIAIKSNQATHISSSSKHLLTWWLHFCFCLHIKHHS